MSSSHLKWGKDDECEECGLSASKFEELEGERDQLRAALQEIAEYPLSDYGGVIARKALGIEE